MPLDTLHGVAIARTAAELRDRVRQWRIAGETLGLVPTMGALHQGHLSLVHLARQHADRVAMSIFVNPLQFAPSEDFGAYPRQLAADCAVAASAGVDLIFAPRPETMYPPGFQTHVEVEQLTQFLCGASRPGHFRGVTTVVCKLLNLVLADVAIFGEKDWQQLQAIRRMALDLDHPTAILGGPIVREANGLAMSSRNAYLSAEQRERAAAIWQSLQAVSRAVKAGERDVVTLQAQMRAAIEAAGGRLDYADLRDAESLEPLDRVDRPARALIAAFFGPARLIDNCAIAP